MNKKITAVTLTALMVLTMFTALVPAVAGVTAEQVSAPYEFYGAVNDTLKLNDVNFNLTSKLNPSILYYDLEDSEGKESLNLTLKKDQAKIIGDSILYETTIYPDKDSNEPKIAWLGQPYYVVDNSSDFYLSEILLDEDEDDTYLLRVGESLTLPEGFAVTPLEIDVDGGEAWFSVTQDGEEVESTVTKEDTLFQYKTDLNDSGKDNNWVLKFNVETVFAGMNTNLVKINKTQLISPDVLVVESGDKDLISDYEITFPTQMSIKIEREKSDDDVSLAKDGIRTFMDRFNVRINKDGDTAAVVKVVEVGGGPAPTATTTEVGTEEATEEPTNVTGVEPGVPTEGPTEVATETPTPEPTEEPGFEAVFAVAGLLAVAYLVLRQRE